MVLMENASNVGVWGNVLNNNFIIIDSFIGELIASRGTYPTGAKRLEAIESAATSVSLSVTKNTDDIDSIKKTVDSNTLTLSSVSKELSEDSSLIKTIDNKISLINTELASNKNKISSIESKNAEEDLKISTLEASLLKLQESEDLSKQNITKALGDIDVINETIKSIKLRQDETSSSIESIKNSILLSDKNMAEIKESVAKIKATVEARVGSIDSSYSVAKVQKVVISFQREASGNTTIVAEFPELEDYYYITINGNTEVRQSSIVSKRIFSSQNGKSLELIFDDTVDQDLNTITIIAIG